MIEGLKEALRLIQHETNKLNRLMLGQDWDSESMGYANGLERAEELVQNFLNNAKALDANK